MTYDRIVSILDIAAEEEIGVVLEVVGDVDIALARIYKVKKDFSRLTWNDLQIRRKEARALGGDLVITKGSKIPPRPRMDDLLREELEF